MLKSTPAFSSFSVSELAPAKAFYQDKLGLEVKEQYGGLSLVTTGNQDIMVYPKADAHIPATFTVLNFIVEDIEQAVADLGKKGVTFEQYNMKDIQTDPRGISNMGHGGPIMAWFKDPAGNIFSLMQMPAKK